LARNKDGEFYTRRIDVTDDEEMKDRILSARTGFDRGIRIGALTTPVLGPAGGVVGGALGAISGFILGDSETVFPIDMIAIPAYQAYLLASPPAFQIYIKEGEVLTQVIPTDAMMASEELSPTIITKKKRKPSKYNRAYSKAFDRIKKDFKLKSGKWAKNGFKRAVKEAHRVVKLEMSK